MNSFDKLINWIYCESRQLFPFTIFNRVGVCKWSATQADRHTHQKKKKTRTDSIWKVFAPFMSKNECRKKKQEIKFTHSHFQSLEFIYDVHRFVNIRAMCDQPHHKWHICKCTLHEFKTQICRKAVGQLLTFLFLILYILLYPPILMTNIRKTLNQERHHYLATRKWAMVSVS